MLLTSELCVEELLQSVVYILGVTTRPQFGAASGLAAGPQLCSLAAASL